MFTPLTDKCIESFMPKKFHHIGQEICVSISLSVRLFGIILRKNYYFFIKKITFIIFIEFVLDFLENYFVKKNLF
jgi:hypothetical protein